ncbi:hypothetical protein AVEN_203981-1 [Araneus ventricosus]|uniref:Uncharacterized protein n=1 Tax=Araneus ventricosus TaxID=182803 RepID=A0A4Y2SCD0_ARAVE|nr:hypothetical protein AVEN_116472-1 [Araneus ventricosus]GBN85903.1 hypothetical protein AVEN_203981-1 [Araneus ventricosus]
MGYRNYGQSEKGIRTVVSRSKDPRRNSHFQSLEIDSGPLPENRVRDAAVFQITGVDAAGPLFLTGNQKAWLLLFTCAVYRAVHLELITSLTTEAFLMGFVGLQQDAEDALLFIATTAPISLELPIYYMAWIGIKL